jgi:hypothetical protein
VIVLGSRRLSGGGNQRCNDAGGAVADSWSHYFEGGCKHVWFHLHIADPAPPPAAFAVMPSAWVPVDSAAAP